MAAPFGPEQALEFLENISEDKIRDDSEFEDKISDENDDMEKCDDSNCHDTDFYEVSNKATNKESPLPS